MFGVLQRERCCSSQCPGSACPRVIHGSPPDLIDRFRVPQIEHSPDGRHYQCMMPGIDTVLRNEAGLQTPPCTQHCRVALSGLVFRPIQVGPLPLWRPEEHCYDSYITSYGFSTQTNLLIPTHHTSPPFPPNHFRSIGNHAYHSFNRLCAFCGGCSAG